MRHPKLLLFTMIFILLTGCQSNQYEPISIKVNDNVCYTCHMGIENVSQATQVLLKDGTPRLFDDIGCMVEYLATTQDQVEIAYVHDTPTGEWIPFATAHYVQDQSIHTPMSYGIAAFQTEQAAQKFQQEHGGHLYTSNELLQLDIKASKAHGGH